jgi:hypothetical protein
VIICDDTVVLDSVTQQWHSILMWRGEIAFNATFVAQFGQAA